MLHPVNKAKLNVGRLLALLFGLTLLLDVLVLPMVSTCDLQHENAMVTVGEELDEKESEKTDDLFALLSAIVTAVLLDLPENPSLPGTDFATSEVSLSPPIPIFLSNRNLRI